MALAPGTRLGVYEVTEHIGAGGMGEVYRATDSNLKRSVAIKVLPASVAGDADRLARFQREAEMLAAALQDNHRAMLIGSQTFGQGLIHSVQPLSDGSAVVIAIARFTTPAGKDVLHRGITPDVAVPSSEMDDPRGTAPRRNRQYREAVDLLTAEIARSHK